MPNWCHNQLTIYAKNNEKTSEFLNKLYEASGKETLNKFIIPFSDMGLNEWDYGSCVEHWGTKWDIGLISKEISKSDKNINVEIEYQTAWSPNIPVLEKLYEILCELDPECTVQSYYNESGLNFYGIFINGEDNFAEINVLYRINSDDLVGIEVEEGSESLIIASSESNLFFIIKEKRKYSDHEIVNNWKAEVEEFICFSNIGEEVSLYKVEGIYYIDSYFL
jgi:hypothetical protein